MNDEPLIRLRLRKSKHGPNENPRKYAGILRSMLRIVQGTITLERQPSREEAIVWTKWLLAQGVTVSIGLLQVNSEHAKALHVTVEHLFEPCTNRWAGATLLTRTYSATARMQGEGLPALDTALSYYNTGTPHLGFQNGYVNQVKLNTNPR